MKRMSWIRSLKTGLLAMLVVGLLAGLALPVAAADNKTGSPSPAAKPNVVKGKVVSIAADKTSFVIEDGKGNQTPIKVDANTRYQKVSLLARVQTTTATKPAAPKKAVQPKATPPASGADKGKTVDRGLGPDVKKAVPANPAPKQANAAQAAANKAEQALEALAKTGEKATFDDIAVNDTVVVKLMPNENLAKLVVIYKRGDLARVAGTITAVGPGTITVTPQQGGAAVPLKWDSTTRFVLRGLIAVQTGQSAVAVYNVKTMLAKTVTVKPAA